MQKIPLPAKVKLESSEFSSTSPEVHNSLSKESKGRYESTYQKFIDWSRKNKATKCTESVLLEYFRTITHKRSLWSIYTMLKSCLLLYQNIDISQFSKLRLYIKRQSQHCKPKKSTVLEDLHITKFITEAPDSKFLMMKAALVLGVSGMCGRGELCNMKPSDLEFKAETVVVTLSKTQTNTPRTFVVSNTQWVDVLKKYNTARKTNHPRFFLTYRNGNCIKSPVGVNTIGKIPSKIARYLQLPNPERYTGHCFRRSSATVMADDDLVEVKEELEEEWDESYSQDPLQIETELSGKISSLPSTSLIKHEIIDTQEAFTPVFIKNCN